MKNKNRFNLLFNIGFIVVGICLIIISIILYIDNNKLENQLIKSEALIDEIMIQDSINAIQKSNSNRIIEKYIEGCNILINGKEVSTEDLVLFMNEKIKENKNLSKSYNKLLKSYNEHVKEYNSLLKSKSNIEDSLSVYKSIVKYSEENFNIKYTVMKDTDKYIAEIYSSDSIQYYKNIYENFKKMIKNKYHIDYQLEDGKDYLRFTKEPSKIDSLMLFYEDIYFKEKNGKIKIILK